MKIAQKYIIFLSLILYAHSTQTMKLPSKMGKSFKSIGYKLLGKQSDEPFNLSDLPEDIQRYIIELMAKYSNAKSLKIASKALRSLSQTSTTFYQLINNSQFNEELLSYLAHRFECSMDDAAHFLATPAAQNYLNKSLMHLIASNDPQDIESFFALSTNINAPLDENGNTPIMLAIYDLAFNSIIALLSHKDLNLMAKNNDGNTVLHLAFYRLLYLHAQQDEENYSQLKKIVIGIMKKCKTQEQRDYLLYTPNKAGHRASSLVFDLDDSNFSVQFGKASGETL